MRKETAYCDGLNCDEEEEWNFTEDVNGGDVNVTGERRDGSKRTFLCVQLEMGSDGEEGYLFDLCPKCAVLFKRAVQSTLKPDEPATVPPPEPAGRKRAH